MITAKLHGRRLALSVWDDEPDQGEPLALFLVEPMSGKAGRELSTRYVYALEGIPVEDGSVGDDMVAAFGIENYERADAELSGSEGELLAQAAYLWQSVGGLDAVRELLAVQEDGGQGGEAGMGKALAVFRSRVVPLLSQIRHRLESAHQMLAESTPATASPLGGVKHASSDAGTSSEKPKRTGLGLPANAPSSPPTAG